MPSESRHIAVHVERPVDEVYAYASDPSHLPDWAPGLCTSITPVDDHWVAESGMGSIIVRYAEPNPYGVAFAGRWRCSAGGGWRLAVLSGDADDWAASIGRGDKVPVEGVPREVAEHV